MRIVQVAPSVSSESSGVTYCVMSLSDALLEAGQDTSVHVLNPIGVHEYKTPIVGYPRSSFPSARLGRSPEMYIALKALCGKSDIIHTNGLWMFPNTYPAKARKGTGCKLIVQPHGTLSKWSLSRSKYIKKIFGLFCGQYAALKEADLLVATCEDEYDDIRRFGLRNPVAILPNGVDIPKQVLPKAERRQLVFLSRIHPKKNLDLLIRIWGKIEHRYPDWDLLIAGPDRDNPYADQMKRLATTLGCMRVSFTGELKGEDKFRFLSTSECLVLPTYSENFGMVVAEALAAGTTAICSKGAPWSGLDMYGCGKWVELDEASFQAAIVQVLSAARNVLVDMGLKGRRWMAEEFSWQSIGKQMLDCYGWLQGVVDKPDCVRID